MAQVLSLSSPRPPLAILKPSFIASDPLSTTASTSRCRFALLQCKLSCNARFSCFFRDNRKQEQARKALESALGGKKTEFEKWNKQIQKREEMGGGGNAGKGGWFGGGGWFGWFHDENFWKESQAASLALVGIIFVYLLIAKGNLMLAVVLNSLLLVLRGTRNGFRFLSSLTSRKISPSKSFPSQKLNRVEQTQISAKDSVVRKWGID